MTLSAIAGKNTPDSPSLAKILLIGIISDTIWDIEDPNASPMAKESHTTRNKVFTLNIITTGIMKRAIALLCMKIIINAHK